jgi:phenylacetate-CoA ligase
MIYFSKDNREFDSQESIESLQTKLLLKHVSYVVSNSPYYKRIFKESSLSKDSINSLSDLKKIPTCTKEDLEQYNDDFHCVSQKEIIEYVTTSGTLGKPISISLSKNDLERLSYNEARALKIGGVDDSDVIQITTTLDKRFMAGMAYYLGATSIGAAVIRTGIGNPGFQWENILRFKPQTLIAVPSFIYKLSSYAISNGINPNLSEVKKAICIGEPIRNADFSPNKLNDKIRKNWNIDLYSTYASTEMATAFTECKAKQGGHLIPELLIVEILDDDGNEVAPGEIGEVTVTPLGVEAMPLLRFRTGDLARVHNEPCSCGRNTLRLSPVEGRKQQMIKLKGTTIFPQSIENILQGFDSIDVHVLELCDSELGTDHVKIYLSDALPKKEVVDILSALKSALRVSPEIIQISHDQLVSKLFPPGSRKPQRIIDNRKLVSQ